MIKFVTKAIKYERFDHFRHFFVINMKFLLQVMFDVAGI
jgi:hypothetical protein